MRVMVRLLGPLEVDSGGQPVTVGAAKERLVLMLLALNAGRLVSVERLVDLLWGDHPTESAIASVRVLVSRLRKAFAAAGFRGVIQTRSPGYVLVSQLVDVDVHLFEALASRGRAQLAAGEAGQAVTTLREALAFGMGTRWLSAAIRGWPVRRRVCWRNEWRR